MSKMRGGSDDCLTEEQVLAFYEGRLVGEALGRLEAHVDACDACRRWLSELALDGESPAPSATFAPGQRIAGRYCVLRFIAQGGMGEVYEVDDLELGARVALKTVRVVLSDDRRTVERLKQEVALARRVTHENVCRIFDLGSDQVGAERVTFLTMELLAGESLAERLKRGTLSVAEALPVVRQMGAALAAAHRVGVVHRDFKPSNVMLVPSAGGVRAVVTDFGLARDAESNLTASFSESLTVVGSPAYMAPEQVEAATLGPPADVYALGVVMFEMLAGQLPFRGTTRLQLAMMRLRERAPSAGRFVADLPVAWERLISRCLERQPEERFANAGEFLAALEGDRVARPLRRRRAAMVAAALLALVAGGGGLFALRHARRAAEHASSAARPPLRRGVAVLGFRDLSGRNQSAWLSTAFAEMLSSELAAGEQLRVAGGEVVARMMHDLALAPGERHDAATLARIRRRLDADWVLTGSYLPEGDRLRLDVALENSGAGDTVVVVSESGRSDQVIDLIDRVGKRLRAHLSIAERPAGADDAERALPKDAEAAQLYVEGLVRRRAYDIKGARERLERAVAREPTFPLAHAQLADIYEGLGRRRQALDEAKRALDLAAPLSREERLAVEARYHTIAQSWPRAIDLYRALYTFFPDELSYGLDLARAQVLAGQSPKAIETLAELRRMPAPLAEDPRIDSREALAWAKQGDWKKRLYFNERAIEKARAMGARVLVADNQLGAAEACISLGDPRRARELYRQAKSVYQEIGDSGGVIKATVGLAFIARSEGDSRGALREYELAAKFYRDEGDDFGLADELNVAAQIYEELGDHARARQLFDEALAHFRTIDEREGIANVLANSAAMLMLEGDLDEAARRQTEAVAIYRVVGMRSHEASTNGDLALILRRRGQMAEARARLTASLTTLAELGDKAKRTQYLADLGDLEREQDHLAAANKAYGQAMALAVERGDKISIDQINGYLAALAVDEGRPAEGERTARDAAARYAKSGPKEAEATFLEILVRALLAQHKDAEARATAERALALVGDSQDPATRLVVARTAARARATHDCALALKEAAATDEMSARRQPLDDRLEAGLTRGTVELECGHGDAGRARLERVAASAAKSGFFRLARQARAR